MPGVSVLIKPSSGLCNMSCDYCFYCDEAEKRRQASYGFMTEETLKNVIRKTMLRAEGYAGYAFQGGEPTLRGLEFFEKVLFYEEKYNRNDLQVTNALQTNGLLLNDDWCRFLKEHHFLTGISVDGTKEIHDLHRHAKDGTGTHERICESIRRMEKYGADYNILTVVNRDTAEHIEEIYRYYRSMGWNYQQYIACLDPLGEGHKGGPYALMPKIYGKFLVTLFDLWYADWKKGKQPYNRQFENYLGILLGVYPEACDQRGCCSVQYVVEADGSVYPCDFYMLDEYRLGNFNEDRLPQIDEKRKQIGFIENSIKIDNKCAACPYHGICRGGCFRTKDLIPETGTRRTYFCESYRTFFDACLDRLKEIAQTLKG